MEVSVPGNDAGTRDVDKPDRLAILVVGLGSIGRRHARLISERNDVELLLCDLQPRFIDETCALLARPPAHSFDSFQTALAAKPAIVFVCTPSGRHASMALAAIEAGCDVFVEKPICTTCDDARNVIAAAEHAGRILQVGYMLRFESGLIRVQALVAAGAVGEIVGGRTMIGTYVTLKNARDVDRNQSAYSLLLDYTHEFDFLRWIFGDVQSLTATAATLGRLELRPHPNVFQALLTMESGALVQVHLDYIQHPQRRILEVYGDRGTIVYDLMSGTLSSLPANEGESATITEFGRLVERIDDVYRAQLDHLLASCRDRTAPAVDGGAAFEALRVVEAAISSIETRRHVELPTTTTVI